MVMQKIDMIDRKHAKLQKQRQQEEALNLPPTGRVDYFNPQNTGANEYLHSVKGEQDQQQAESASPSVTDGSAVTPNRPHILSESDDENNKDKMQELLRKSLKDALEKHAK